jgi:hypothetical protein
MVEIHGWMTGHGRIGTVVDDEDAEQEAAASGGPTTAGGGPSAASGDDMPSVDDRDWERVLGSWSAELDRAAWVTVSEAQAAAGVSRSALRSWYRRGEVPSRLVAGPHGPQRLVHLDTVLDRSSHTRRAERPPPAPPSPVPAEPSAMVETLHDLVDVIRQQAVERAERAEARADRLEEALLAARERAAAAEAERDLLREQLQRPDAG